MTSERHTYSWWKSELEGIRSTSDGFLALCPSHADATPSLHVTRKAGDQAVIHCLAGCTYEDVLAATSNDVRAPIVRKVNGSNGAAHGTHAHTYARPFAWLSARLAGIPIEFLETLPLREDQGKVAFTFPHTSMVKTRATSEDKQWAWVPKGGATPPLWPMPTNAMPDTIILSEGESDCITLRWLKEIGVVAHDAYGITHGAGTGKDLPRAIYAGLAKAGVKHIVLAFDQDDAGDKAIEEFSQSITDAHMGVSTLRPELFPFDGETDISDWYKRTHGLSPLEPVSLEVGASLETLVSQTSSDTQWVTPGYFARDAITIVSGPPKSGKSTLIAHYLACHEQGEAFLGEPTRRGKAFLMTEEFVPTILEKTTQYGIKDIAVLTQNHAALNQWSFTDALTRAVRQSQEQGRDVLVIDTLSAWAQFKDENDASEITRVLMAIRNAVGGSGISVVLIHHTRKGGGEHGEAVRGSSALFALTEISLEYAYKDRNTRQVEVSSRFANAPEPTLVRMGDDGNLEVVDQAEWNIEEAQPIIDALREGPMGVQELKDASGLASDTTIRRHLQALETLGKVEVSVGQHGKKTYTLVDDGLGASAYKIRKVKRG